MAPIGGCWPSGNEAWVREQAKKIEHHAPTICKRIASSADFHTRSWSFRFQCPECGAARRQNTNFLGSRFQLVCDGQRITRQPKAKAVRS